MKLWDPPTDEDYTPPDPVEVAGWTGLAVGLLIGAAAMMGIYETSTIECLEDEALIAATNECVPIEDIQEAAVDLYVEAVMQEGR